MLPELATTPKPPGGREGLAPDWRSVGAAGVPQAGLERVSATKLDWQAMWRMVGENSTMNNKCRCCRPDHGSEYRLRAPTSGLWSVKIVKGRPYSMKRKCGHHSEKLPIKCAVINLSFVQLAEKNPRGRHPCPAVSVG